MIEKIYHTLIQYSCYKKYKGFLELLQNPQVSIKSKRQFYQDYFEGIELSGPVTSYTDYKKNESSILEDKNIVKFEQTSGSGGKVKSIPYTDTFLKELDEAISPWLYDLYQSYPQIKKGRHYWSLSWVPHHLREKVDTNDLELLSPFKKIIMKKTLVNTKDILKAKTEISSHYYLCLKLLSCQDITLISIWSPTFLLRILAKILDEDQTLLNMLKTQSWAELKEDLEEIEFPMDREQSKRIYNIINQDKEIKYKLKKIWPQLALISCWGDSYSEVFFYKLRKIFPHVEFQAKGLWATEGVISFPFQNKNVLAINSHLIEFYACNKEEIVSLLELKKDREYYPLLTTANGMVRYNLLDKIRVTGFLGKTPCIEFLGRDKVMDILGEKIPFEYAQSILKKINVEFKIEAISIGVNITQENIYYFLLAGNENKVAKIEIENFLEEELCRIHHYRLARQLDQLDQAKVLNVLNPLVYYRKHMKESVSIEGNLKVEPIFIVKENHEIP